jgi:hypothetical protein
MPDDYSGFPPWWNASYAAVAVPSTLVAGDTWQWKQAFLPFPAGSNYTLAYFFANAANAFTIAGGAVTTANSIFSILFAASATAALTPGKYRWQAYITDQVGVRTTVAEGWTTVTPNLATGSPVDLRSYNRQVLDAIEALLTGRLVTDAARYTIGNRSLDKLSPADLIIARSTYRWLVFHEKRKENMANGLADPKRLLVRFNRG